MGKYHKGIRIEGAEEFLLAVNITGHGAPTEDTEAEPGMCYLDEDSENGDLYKCIGMLVTETGTVYRWKKLAGQEEVDQLSEAIANKANSAGWTANKYIGTDTEGNLVEKDVPTADESLTKQYFLMQSPNGTIYKVTITDSGVFQIVGESDVVLEDLVNGRLLAWHDEFDMLDTTIWGYEEGHVRAAHVVYFVADEKNVFVKDSCVHFKALRDNPTSDFEWSAGGLGTDINIGSGFTFKNGLLEFKVKIPVIGSGRWATIWCLGAINKKTTIDGTTATRGLKSSMCGEIDIMDYVGGSFPLVYYSQDIYSEIFDTYKDGNETLTQNEWHILGIEKSTNELIFYVDREEKGRLDLTGVESFNDKAFNIKMNCVVGGASGTISDDMTEMEMIVDWVRYYLPQSESEVVSTLTADIGMTEFELNKGLNRAIYPTFNDNADNYFVEWYSSDASVATAYGGYVKALKNGTTKITGKDVNGNTLFETDLTVSDDAYNPIEKIVATNTPGELYYDTPVTLTYLCYPEYATNKTCTVTCNDSAVSCVGDVVTLIEELSEDRTVSITLTNAEGNVSTEFEVGLHKSISLGLSDTTGLIHEYNQDGLTYGTNESYVYWNDNKGNGEQIYFAGSGANVYQKWSANGLIVNTANVRGGSTRTIRSEELEEFTAFCYHEAGTATSGKYFSVNGIGIAKSANTQLVSETITDGAVQLECKMIVEDASALKVFIIKRDSAGYRIGYYDGTDVIFGDVLTKENTEYYSRIGAYAASGQVAIGTYRHIAIYDIAKTDAEIKAIAEELITMY